jgi:hypothetical protein
MRGIMIDIETLSLEPDAHILSIGACTMDLQHQFYHVMGTEEQGRKISIPTLAWWMAQPDSVRCEVFDTGDNGKPSRPQFSPLVVALVALEVFYRKHADGEQVWSKHPTLDISVLEHAYRQHKIQIPWGFRSVMDYATALNIWRYKYSTSQKAHPKTFRITEEHNALGDAIRQAEELQTVASDLGL